MDRVFSKMDRVCNNSCLCFIRLDGYMVTPTLNNSTKSEREEETGLVRIQTAFRQRDFHLLGGDNLLRHFRFFVDLFSVGQAISG